MRLTIKKQLEDANKRIDYLETEVEILQSALSRRVSPYMFGRVLLAFSKLTSTEALVDALIEPSLDTENINSSETKEK